ncbi:MAG: alpha/beta hydrolase [Paraglaciecola sp.]|uniref:alpha/beta hydrolase n=1 Tax=Paraglaciecola sp. TaxID=1920173 RepID=UPI0032970253
MNEPLNTANSDDLDPEIREFKDALNDGYNQFGDLSTRPIEQRRQAAALVRAPWAAGGPSMSSSLDLQVGNMNVRIRIHRPANLENLPALVYLHGGGWVMFSLDTHDRVMREYASRAGVVVVGVDYSLSPEAKFPQAIDEIVSVIHWLRINGNEYGIDSKSIVIGGDSAGGNLSVATNLRLRELREPLCQGMLLNYGVYDNTLRPSYYRYDEHYMLNASEMAMFWDNYLGDIELENDALACPIRADLTDMPPTFMVIAECDVLVDENLAMAKSLKKAGVDVQAQVYKGTAHSFLEAVSISAISDRAFSDTSLWLKNILNIHESV